MYFSHSVSISLSSTSPFSLLFFLFFNIYGLKGKLHLNLFLTRPTLFSLLSPRYNWLCFQLSEIVVGALFCCTSFRMILMGFIVFRQILTIRDRGKRTGITKEEMDEGHCLQWCIDSLAMSRLFVSLLSQLWSCDLWVILRDGFLIYWFLFAFFVPYYSILGQLQLQSTNSIQWINHCCQTRTSQTTSSTHSQNPKAIFLQN